jgi:hypothetical protein
MWLSSAVRVVCPASHPSVVRQSCHHVPIAPEYARGMAM